MLGRVVLLITLLLPGSFSYRCGIGRPGVRRLRWLPAAVDAREWDQHANKPPRYFPLVTEFGTGVASDSSSGPPALSSAAAKQELLQLTKHQALPLSLEDHLRVLHLSRMLAASYVSVHTVPFLNLVLEGAWSKLYSNLRLPASSSVTITSTQQTIHTATNTMVEELQFSYQPSAGSSSFAGMFAIHSNFTYTSRGEMQTMLDKHQLMPDGPIPEDVDSFLLALQRGVPRDAFDPSDCTARILYLDPELRIQQVFGPQLAEVLNIYSRP